MLFSTSVIFSNNEVADLCVLNLNRADTIIPDNTDQHNIFINYYKSADENQTNQLEKILGASIDFYVDESITIINGEINFRKSSKKMIKDLNEIVKDGIKYYDYKEIASFEGFSKRVELKIEELYYLDLSIYNIDQVEDENERGELLYYYVQRELNDLKLLLNIEIGNFTNENMLILSGVQISGLNAENQEDLLNEIKNFNVYDPLKTIEIELSENTIAILSPNDESSFENENSTEDSFKTQVLELLNNNNEKLSELDDRIKLLESGDNNGQNLDDIKELIRQSISDDNQVIPIKELPNNLPTEIVVYFEKGSSNLSLASKLIINEVIDIMVRNPNLGLIVTGYSDQIGNSQENYKLSKNRASKVRQLALDSGVENHRILMNYFGESKSIGSNPGDRKVVIEFIQF